MKFAYNKGGIDINIKRLTFYKQVIIKAKVS